MEGHEALAPDGTGPVVQLRQPQPGSALSATMAHGLPHSVDPTPHDEGPLGAVPQAAQQHGHEDVDGGPDPAVPVPAERDVQVIAQPPRQRHVPPPPEVLQRPRRVRAIEVLGEVEPEEQRDTDGDVGVPAEVGVDLRGEAVYGEQDLERTVCRRIPEHRIHDGRGQEARDHDLLEQPPEDEVRGPAHVQSPRVPPGPDLGQQLRATDDGSRYEVWEEGEVHEQVQRGGGLDLAAVHVHHVADGHEGVERQPHREDQPDQGQRDVDADAVQAVGHVREEEVVVLEVGERREQRRDGHAHHEAPAGLRDTAHGERAGLGQDSRQRQEPHVVPVPPRVEHVARGDHEHLPPRRGGLQQPVRQEDDAEEDGEISCGEEHSRPGPV